MNVSVIVITRHISDKSIHVSARNAWNDRLAILTECIPSVHRNAGYPHEFIVVCNGDGEHIKRITSLKEGWNIDKLVVFDKPLGPSGARQVGYIECSGDMIAFIDDDMLLSENWLLRHVEFIHDNNIDMQRTWFSMFPGPDSNKTETADRIVNCKSSEAALMMARDLFERVGGFRDGRHWSFLRKDLNAAGFKRAITIKPVVAKHAGNERRKLFREYDGVARAKEHVEAYIKQRQ